MPYQTERKRELFMAEKMRDGKVRCSFCHKSEDQVRKLIAGPEGVFICDECIGICSEIMEEELAQYDTEDVYDSDINLLKPMTMSLDRMKPKRLCLWLSITITKELPHLRILMWNCRKVIF